ncbi:interferon lambda-1 [Nannospalax galili]|uniref:interferon lambda-1 n=1 Tax=Nannospalax galili TaxID=1026970 RepID=UPI0004ED1047|nr:interferon lambda-1 [Nannospalax galili]
MVAVWLLLPAAIMLGLAIAAPFPPSKPTTAKTSCHINSFQSLSQQELNTFKKAKDALEETLLQKDVRCSTKPFPSGWDLRQLQVQERPEALQAELAPTLKVLESVAEPSLRTLLYQPLHTLRHIRSQLHTCIPGPPIADPRPQSHRLSHWLHLLWKAQKKETPGCLQASVTFNLYCLLTRDLKCVASGDQGV